MRNIISANKIEVLSIILFLVVLVVLLSTHFVIFAGGYAFVPYKDGYKMTYKYEVARAVKFYFDKDKINSVDTYIVAGDVKIDRSPVYVLDYFTFDFLRANSMELKDGMIIYFGDK